MQLRDEFQAPTILTGNGGSQKSIEYIQDRKKI